MISNKFWSGFGIALFSILLLFSIFLTSITHHIPETLESVGLIYFFANHHVILMLLTNLLAIGFGFIWAIMLQKKVAQTQAETRDIFSVVKSFLSKEEKDALEHLVQNRGSSTQANIARLQNMGNVKALRTVQKLIQKNLVDIEANGKVRKVILKTHIAELLDLPE